MVKGTTAVQKGTIERRTGSLTRAARRITPFITVALAGSLLITALWAGLARLGWVTAPVQAVFAHGALMVCGFLGTLISLERASALEKPLFFTVPVLAALGGLALLAGLPPVLAQGLWVAAALGLLLIFRHIHRLQPALHTRVIAAGALLWAGGNFLWLMGLPLAQVTPWWAGFLIFTIIGERLELTRLRRPSRLSTMTLLVALGLMASGLLLSLRYPAPGFRVMGAALLAQALWLLTQDIARRTVRQEGATRFIALCLLTGYFWLGLSGALWMRMGNAGGGVSFDAMLHGVFVGFVISMIFGHALIIFPGVFQVEIPYHARFYTHLILLHLSLGIRVLGAFTAYGGEAVRWGGLLNVAAVMLFMLNSAGAALIHILKGRRRRPAGNELLQNPC